MMIMMMMMMMMMIVFCMKRSSLLTFSYIIVDGGLRVTKAACVMGARSDKPRGLLLPVGRADHWVDRAQVQDPQFREQAGHANPAGRVTR